MLRRTIRQWLNLPGRGLGLQAAECALVGVGVEAVVIKPIMTTGITPVLFPPHRGGRSFRRRPTDASLHQMNRTTKIRGYLGSAQTHTIPRLERAVRRAANGLRVMGTGANFGRQKGTNERMTLHSAGQQRRQSRTDRFNFHGHYGRRKERGFNLSEYGIIGRGGPPKRFP